MVFWRFLGGTAGKISARNFGWISENFPQEFSEELHGKVSEEFLRFFFAKNHAANFEDNFGNLIENKNLCWVSRWNSQKNFYLSIRNLRKNSSGNLQKNFCFLKDFLRVSGWHFLRIFKGSFEDIFEEFSGEFPKEIVKELPEKHSEKCAEKCSSKFQELSEEITRKLPEWQEILENFQKFLG